MSSDRNGSSKLEEVQVYNSKSSSLNSLSNLKKAGIELNFNDKAKVKYINLSSIKFKDTSVPALGYTVSNIKFTTVAQTEKESNNQGEVSSVFFTVFLIIIGVLVMILIFKKINFGNDKYEEA